MVVQEFDLATTPNKEIMIQYFRKSLKPSIWVQLDTQGRELDFEEEIVKKAVNIKVKVLPQSSSNIREIDSKCS